TERVWTAGANYYLNPNVVFKVDYQHFNYDDEALGYGNRFDLGLGYQFCSSMKVRWLLPFGLVATPIAHVAFAAQYMTVEQAPRAALPDATEFAAHALDAPGLAPSGVPPGWAPKAWLARAEGRELGWLMVDQ